nr:type II toxin-antitoxin system RelE/ParE family toxin [Rhodopseudomonas palustris]
MLAAAMDVAEGRWDASLGGGVFKQRIGRKGGGKSGGFRTIIVCKMGAHSFFVQGFAKNQKANVSSKELEALKKLATVLLALDVGALETAIAAGEISEVTEQT